MDRRLPLQHIVRHVTQGSSLVVTLCRKMEKELDTVMHPSLREIATDIAWKLLYVPYRWAGDDPMAGFDCSGLVVEILRSVGLLGRREDLSAEGLWLRFNPFQVDTPDEGCLVFYTNSARKVCHVEYCVSQALSIGASGGGPTTMTHAQAIEQNAYVKIRPFAGRPNLFAFVDPFISVEMAMP